MPIVMSYTDLHMMRERRATAITKQMHWPPQVIDNVNPKYKFYRLSIIL